LQRKIEYWEKVKEDRWNNKLYKLITDITANQAMNQQLVYNVVVSNNYRYNQRISVLRAKFMMDGKDLQLVELAISV
jgi:hypothetical protein